MARRYYSSTAARTTLASGVNDSTTTFTVAAVSGWPSSFPYTLIIDQDTINEEIVEVTARSGTTLTVTRGVDGTTGVAHDAGAAVNHGVSARDFDEPNAFINGTDFVSTDGGSTVTASGAAVVPLTLKGASGQTANLLTMQSDNAANVYLQAEGNANLVIQRSDGTTNAQPEVQFYKSTGTISSPTAVVAGDNLGGISFRGFDGTGWLRAAQILAEVDTTPGANDMPGRLMFLTTPDGANAPTERMRVNQVGAVMIGTTTPGSASTGDLVVNGGVFLGGTAAANELDDYEEGTWTPTWGGLTVGNGSVSAKYTKIGRTVHIQVGVVLGSTSAVTGRITFTNPIVGSSTCTGYAHATQTGVGLYPMLPVVTSSITYFDAIQANQTYAVRAISGTTVPFTWGNTDSINVSATYEAA